MMEEWINEEGEVTTFSFNIYTYYGVRDNAIINVGLTKKLLDSSMSDVRYYQSVLDVEEEDTRLWNLKRGLNVQWIFPKNVHPSCRKMIINTITEGLDFLEMEYDLLGVYGDAN
tara:strand:- start:1128 stop:1469 length:342 start_codon:yes stop_codon:yes gene_type:complete